MTKQIRTRVRFLALALCALLLPLSALADTGTTLTAAKAAYDQGVAQLSTGDLTGAETSFTAANHYADSTAHLQYIAARTALNRGETDDAVTRLWVLTLAGYSGAADWLRYAQGLRAEASGNLLAAAQLYDGITVVGSAQRLESIRGQLQTPAAGEPLPPVGAQAGAYALVAIDDLNLVPSAGSEEAGEPCAKGTILQTVAVTSHDGTAWVQVKRAGAADTDAGYCPADALIFLTDDEAFALISQYETEPMRDVYATINGHLVNVRVRPAPKSTSMAKLERHANVRVLEEGIEGEDGETWTIVQLTDGKEGYVPAQYVDIMSDADREAYMAELGVEDMSPYPDDTYALITGHQVNVRVEAGPKAKSLAKLDMRAHVLVLETVEGSDKEVWYFVRTEDGIEGYMPSAYVKIMKEAERVAYQVSVGVTPRPVLEVEPPATTAPTTQPTPMPTPLHTDPPPADPLPVPEDPAAQYDLALYQLMTGTKEALAQSHELLVNLPDVTGGDSYSIYARLLLAIESGDFDLARGLLSAYAALLPAPDSQTVLPLDLPDAETVSAYLMAREEEAEDTVWGLPERYVKIGMADSIDRAVYLQRRLPLPTPEETLQAIKWVGHEDLREMITPALTVEEETSLLPELHYGYRYKELTQGDPYASWAPINGATKYHVVTCWRTSLGTSFEEARNSDNYKRFNERLNAVGKSDDPLKSVYEVMAASDDLLWQTTETTQANVTEIFAHVEKMAAEKGEGSEYAANFLVFVLYE